MFAKGPRPLCEKNDTSDRCFNYEFLMLFESSKFRSEPCVVCHVSCVASCILFRVSGVINVMCRVLCVVCRVVYRFTLQLKI